MRILGIDLGSRRIGVAVSDSSERLATPYAVLERQGAGARHRDHEAIRRLIEETGAGHLVVGLPLSLDGTAGPSARAALEEVAEMAEVVGVGISVHDERLTTVSAARSMRDAGAARSERRAAVDKAAAAVMLQSWLDGRSG